MKLHIVVLSILLLAGISLAYGEKGTLTREKFVDLYVQLSIAAEQYLDDSLKLVQVQDSIFKAFGVSRQEFEQFRKKIDQQPEKWGDIWKEIVQKLSEIDQKQRNSSKENASKPADKKPEK